jgi:hypothetical protein
MDAIIEDDEYTYVEEDYLDFEDSTTQVFKLISEAIKLCEQHAMTGEKNENGDSVGTIRCPKCKNNLNYFISKYNGHVHGTCETRDCLDWME